jgi:hypothetical protein
VKSVSQFSNPIVGGASNGLWLGGSVLRNSLFLVSISIKRYLCESTVATLYSWAGNDLLREVDPR